MSCIDGLAHRLRRLFRPNAFRRELDEEVQFHLELDALQAQDARRFGNRTYYKEETRRMTWLGVFDPLRQDLGYALRSIKRAPGFTVLVVLTLALGLGTTSALFSLIDRLYLRPLPGIANPATLTRIWIQHFRTGDGVPVAAQTMNLRRYNAISSVVNGSPHIAAYFGATSLKHGLGPGAVRLHGTYVSSTYFQVLGVQRALGRFFTQDEDRWEAPVYVAVVSHQFWKNRLHSDSSIIGTSIVIERIPYVIVGVTSPAFTGLDLQATDIWLPLAAMPTPPGDGIPWWKSDNTHWLRAVVRTAPNFQPFEFERRATDHLRQANREERTMVLDTATRVLLGPIIEARGPGKPGQEIVISTRLAGVATIVLLIACANVVNLLLARAAQRRRETAVRLALGISRRRLVRLLTLESIVLATIAAVAAVVVGAWSGALLRVMLIPDVAWTESAMHWRVAAFTFALALPLGLIAGVIPASQASKPNVTYDLKAGSRDGFYRSRLRSGLLVMQAALSLLLLAGAGLFVRSLQNVRGLDIGYDSGRLIFGRVQFEDDQTLAAPVLEARMRDVAARLEGQPGIEVVARAAMPPMYGMSFAKFYFGNDSSSSLHARAPGISVVSSGFFKAAGIRMVRGDDFSDRPGASEIIVNQVAASLLWPGREPLGECIRFEGGDRCHTVIGVVENAHQMRVIEEQSAAHIYVALGSRGWEKWTGGTIVIRATAQGTKAASSALHAALRRSFPERDESVTPMSENLEPEYRPWRLGATLFTAFGLLALIVAMVGVYSSVAYSVSQRTHEIGVRLALGARISHILQHMVAAGLRAVVLGMAIGVILTIAAGRVIASLLYDVAPNDAAVLTLVSAGIFAVAAVAALTPALRATHVSPVTSLRAD